jgi:lysophospholipase L1-like esterase
MLTPASTGRQRYYRLVAVVGALAVALAGVEGTLRLLGIGNESLHTGTVPHAQWHHWHQPNFFCQYPVRAEGYSVPIHFNQLGMRDSREFTVEKPAGMRRIAVIGDSFVEGLQVAEENGVVRQLERQLRQPGDERIQVLNFGCSGFSTTLELVLVRDWVRQFAPDVVVCLHHFSDINEDWVYRCQTVQTSTGEISAIPARLAAAEGLMKRCVRHSRLLQVIQQVLGRHPSLPADASYQETFDAVVHDPYTAEDETAWSYSLQALAALADVLRRDNTRFLVVLVPIGTQVEPVDPVYAARLGYRYLAGGCRLEHRGYQEKVRAYCREHGIACLDLLDGFRTANPWGTPWFYLPHDLHWSAAGHELAARHIAEYLRTQRWLAKEASARLPSP